MSVWIVPAHVLARARFAVSPMAEVVGALGHLARDPARADRVFVAAHAEPFARMLAEHPGRRAVVEHHFRRGWLADCLGLPPPSPEPTFEAELALVAARGDERIRADLEFSSPLRLPAILREPGVSEHVTGLLTWLWVHTVAADWPRRERVLRADIVGRTTRLASHGWSGVMRDLGRGREWLGGEELRIGPHDVPPRRLDDDAELFFVPSHWIASWVGWDEPGRYVVHYPVTGALAPPAGGGGGLGRLVGAGRSRVLRALDVPRSTSALVAITGLPLGSVGGHLRVLLDAGLVLRRRSGREVLYWRTALGDGLVSADGPAP